MVTVYILVVDFWPIPDLSTVFDRSFSRRLSAKSHTHHTLDLCILLFICGINKSIVAYVQSIHSHKRLKLNRISRKPAQQPQFESKQEHRRPPPKNGGLWRNVGFDRSACVNVTFENGSKKPTSFDSISWIVNSFSELETLIR